MKTLSEEKLLELWHKYSLADRQGLAIGWDQFHHLVGELVATKPAPPPDKAQKLEAAAERVIDEIREWRKIGNLASTTWIEQTLAEALK